MKNLQCERNKVRVEELREQTLRRSEGKSKKESEREKKKEKEEKKGNSSKRLKLSTVSIGRMQRMKEKE